MSPIIVYMRFQDESIKLRTPNGINASLKENLATVIKSSWEITL